MLLDAIPSGHNLYFFVMLLSRTSSVFERKHDNKSFAESVNFVLVKYFGGSKPSHTLCVLFDTINNDIEKSSDYIKLLYYS